MANARKVYLSHMKKVLVIGCGFPQLGLLRAAKSLVSTS